MSISSGALSSGPVASPSKHYDYDFGYSKFDLVDDNLSLTAPAITGQIAIATTMGLWIDDITVAAGTFDNGPTTYTGGPAGLIEALGAQYIGEIVREGTFTQAEIDLMLATYLPKGCPGLITLGSDLLVNGSFTSDLSGWNHGVNWTWLDGTALSGGGTDDLFQYSLTIGKTYLATFNVSTYVSGGLSVAGSSGGSVTAAGLYRRFMVNMGVTYFDLQAFSFTGAVQEATCREIIFP